MDAGFQFNVSEAVGMAKIRLGKDGNSLTPAEVKMQPQ
jgi:hypothetical protein